MKNKDGVQIIVVCIMGIILICLLLPLGNLNGIFEYKDEKNELKENDIGSGIFIKTNNIVLDNFDNDITISEGGEYNIKGTFNHSVFINANDTVILNLNGVNINSKVTSAIANRGKNDLIINLVSNSTNNLIDYGYSEYDGCIYSKGKLTIDGTGTLNINGNQKDGEGIATTDNDIIINSGKINISSNDDGINVGGNSGYITINGGEININALGDGIDSNGSFVMNGGKLFVLSGEKGKTTGIDTDDGMEINGGDVIAYGSSDYQKPLDSSLQNYIGFSVKNYIEEGSELVFSNNMGLDFKTTANQKFKTFIFSNPELVNGAYYLYVNGEQTEYSFNVGSNDTESSIDFVE